MAKPEIRILVVCISSFSRMGLCDVLSKEKDFKIIKETSTEDETITWVKRESPDIILLCFQLLLECGTDLILKIKCSMKEPKIVVFNYSFNKKQEVLLLGKGVVGVIRSGSRKLTIIKALRKIHSGGHWFREESVQLLTETNSNSNGIKRLEDDVLPLTKRELEVLAYIAAGYKNHEISTKLRVSKATVKTHINNIYRKLDVNDRLQATLYAVKHKLLTGK